MNADQKSIRADRELLKQKYGVLFENVSVILFKADLQGINFVTNTDEYEPEVGTILPRLNEANTAIDVQQIVHEEFCKWFSLESAGSASNYEDVAEKIWAEWHMFTQNPLKL
jgi:hypothetical protein